MREETDRLFPRLPGTEGGVYGRLWHSAAWLGSLGMGLSCFILVARNLHFEYHLFQDIGATSAFLPYPEQQDWWFYIVAVTIVPLGTLVGYGIWHHLCASLQRMGGSRAPRGVAFVTLTYPLWWVDPLTFVIAHRFAMISTYQFGALFVIGQSILFGHAWLETRSFSRPWLVPPPSALVCLAIAGSIAALAAQLRAKAGDDQPISGAFGVGFFD